MNRFKNILTVFAFAILIVGVPTIASAQWRNDRDDDYYGNRNGRYNSNMRSVVNRLENNSREFARRIDRELDRSRYDGSNREDRIVDLAQDFARAAARLEDEFDNGSRRDRNDSSNEARQVLNLGSQLDRALRRARLNYGVQNRWNVISRDLNMLANYYNYNYNNRNNRNRRNDDWRRNIPFPLPF